MWVKEKEDIAELRRKLHWQRDNYDASNYSNEARHYQ